MKIIRWIICFPAAILLSWLAWPLTGQVFDHWYYGGGIERSVIGLAPYFIASSFPAVVLVVSGVWISPSKGRKIVFVFFALGLVYSGGGMEMIIRAGTGELLLWLLSVGGIVLGSLAGLLLGLRLQTYRKGKPNQQPPLQTPASGTPAASSPAAPPPGAAGL